MVMRRRALPGRPVLLGFMGAALLASACHAPVPAGVPNATVSRTGKARVAGDGVAEPLSPVRPGVLLMRGTSAEPPVVTVAGGTGALAIGAGIVNNNGANAQGGVAVSAATGGVVRTADGLVAATIPPGALDRDAHVTLERIEAAGLAVERGYLPAVRFRLDLGPARLAPGTAIAVTSTLEPAVAERFTAAIPAERLADLGLSRDGAGRLSMTMRVGGPAPAGTAPDVADPPEAAWLAQEFGGFPMPAAGAAAAPTRALMALTTPSVPPDKFIPSKMPRNLTEFHALEDAKIFGCDLAMLCFFMQIVLVDRGERAGFDPAACGIVFTKELPPPTATPKPEAGVVNVPVAPPPVVVDTGPCRLPARVSLDSDDPARQDRPVPGAVVRFRLPSGPMFGPNELLTDAKGLATSAAPGGTRFFPQAIGPDGSVASAGQELVAFRGMPRIELKLRDAWPVIMLHVKADRPLPETCKVTYALPRLAIRRELELRIPTPGERHALMDFKVPLPSDVEGPVAFNLQGVDLGDGEAPSLTAPPSIARNGVYPAMADFRGFVAPK